MRTGMSRSAEKKTSGFDAPSFPEEAASLDQIYGRYGARVFRRARRLLRDTDRAEDAMQEVFLRAVQHRAEMSHHSLPWLFRVTTNLCLSDVRDDRRRRHLRSSQPVEPQRDQGTDARVAVKQLLARVPQELREIALCYYVDDLSHDEIAPIFGVSRRTIGNRLAAFQAIANEVFELGAPVDGVED
jgi:RNA polymerase sigma factor (sigma-70 family)